MTRSRFMDIDSSNRSQRRRRVGIPIPTFAVAAATSSATEEGNEKEMEEKQDEEEEEVPQWNAETLLQAEAAISTFCATRKRTTLDLQEFNHLTKALQCPMQMHQASNAGLSTSELLLFDLLTCASPALYELVYCNKHNKRDGKCKTWCLKMIKFVGNRVEKLKSLASVSHVSVNKRQSIRAQIIKCQDKQNQQFAVPVSGTENTPHAIRFSIDTLFPDVALENKQQQQSTVEQRVAARAQAKVDQQNDTPNTSSASEIRLRLADALWSHSRHVLLRQSRLRYLSPNRKEDPTAVAATTSTRPCVMTMKDIVQLLRGNNSTTTRKQLIQAVLEIQQSAPQWIVFDAEMVTKQTTVWIHPVDYQKIRHVLVGSINPGGPTSTLKRKAASTVTESTLTLNNISRQKKDTPRSLTPPPILDRPNLSTPMRAPNANTTLPLGDSLKILVHDREHQTHHHGSLTEQRDESPPRKKRQRVDDQVLRINRHHILTDADYDGGEIIAPSYSSPRGLKGLLTQLNAGQRI